MKQRVHAGHTGINSCLRRARTYLYWPGISEEIWQVCQSCETCLSFQIKQPQQTLILHQIPACPWQKIGADKFTTGSRNYLFQVDYYSQFFEIDYLNDMTSQTIVGKRKKHSARYGILDTIISDNGPQLTSSQFQKFCRQWDIKHETSSPGNSKANGAAEAAVKIAKRMLKKCDHSKEDPYIALLNWRNRPQEGVDATPVQRLMGRRTRTLLPTSHRLLQPGDTDLHKIREQIKKQKIINVNC